MSNARTVNKYYNCRFTVNIWNTNDKLRRHWFKTAQYKLTIEPSLLPSVFHVKTREKQKLQFQLIPWEILPVKFDWKQWGGWRLIFTTFVSLSTSTVAPLQYGNRRGGLEWPYYACFRRVCTKFALFQTMWAVPVIEWCSFYRGVRRDRFDCDFGIVLIISLLPFNLAVLPSGTF